MLRPTEDETLARHDFFAHKHAEGLVGALGVENRYAAHFSNGRIHRRFPKLIRIHFAETFVTLDAFARNAVFGNETGFFVVAENIPNLFSFLKLVERRKRDEYVARVDKRTHVTV